MIKKWECNKIDEEKVNEFSKKNNVSRLLSKVMLSRGFTDDAEVQKFLHPKLDELYDPFLINDMDIAVNRIMEACERKEKVTIYGDYDVDGITSIAVLKSFLLEQGMNVDHYLPSRLEEGYGLNNDAIKKIYEQGTKLLITVDCGISAFNEIEYANELGIEVIVTDHHECPEKLPNALAVLDPKREDSTYPFSSLAGVGVSFKLIQAISYKLNLDRKKYLKYLDIVCLGTVADIVPLLDENRIIVNYGLILMRQTRKVGLQELIVASGYSKIDSTSISFGLAPRLNACGRMGKADLALELILTTDREEARKIALELNEINKERQEVEKRIISEAIETIERDKLYENGIIVVNNENWHHGVIGIVASKITETYYKPSILICMENGKGKGSGRSIEGFDLHGALSKCDDLLDKFGGHEMAIGLSIDESNLNDLKKRLFEIAKESDIEEMQPVIKIDAEVTSDDVSFETIKELEALEPFGEANPSPVFMYRNLKVDSVRALSNAKHLRLVLKDNNFRYDAIAFNMGEKRHSIDIGNRVDIAHSLEINHFNNMDKIQFNLKDIKKSL
jgi:single-stranded-DNA-specific exonuclease